MKKIGILFGQENSFPQAFVDRINEKAEKNISAEFVRIDKMMQGQPLGYSVIVDRISQDVPFYRASLKNAAITGTAVINNPFWWSADEKFFNNALAVKLGIPVPKTALLPSKDHPASTSDRSFRNLAFPLDWDAIFDYVGFPAYMKPFDGGGWRDVYKISDKEDLWDKFAQTHQLVMLLQEEIIFDDYFRCYCIGGKHVRIMQYEPRNPHHLRYEHGKAPASKKMLDTITKYVLQLNQYLGYDFNTVEFAVRDGIPYAIDFCNPAPDAEVTSVGQDNFEWVVETAASYAIERAKAQKDNKDNLTWGEFVKAGAAGKPLIATAAKAAKADVSAGKVDHAITEEAKPKKKAAAPKKAAKK
jgi:glutathione synthase/RimK-type ligase-like ATP-grasp enzyme